MNVLFLLSYVCLVLTHAAGTHTVFMDNDCYRKFLEEFDKVSSHVNKVYKAPVGMGRPKLSRFAKELNVEAPKCLKLSSKETTSMVLFNDRQASVTNVGTQLPDFGSDTPLEDLPSVDTYVGSSFGENSDVKGKL